MRHNDLQQLNALLNEVRYLHFNKISLSGSPNTVLGSIAEKTIRLTALLCEIQEDCLRELNKADRESEKHFFESHPELNP